MFIVRLRILRWLHFHALRSRSALRTFDVIDGLSEHLLYIAPRTNKAWAVVIVDLRYGCAFSAPLTVGSDGVTPDFGQHRVLAMHPC